MKKLKSIGNQNSYKDGKKSVFERKGITFLILLITIVFVLIVTSGLTISFFNVIDSTNKREYANELNSVQNLVDQYEYMNGKYPVTDNVFSFALVTLPVDEKKQFSEEPGYDDNEIILTEINLHEAGANEITRGIRRNNNEDDIYVVSESTGRVYYLKGEEYDDYIYYTLTDDLKDGLGI